MLSPSASIEHYFIQNGENFYRKSRILKRVWLLSHGAVIIGALNRETGEIMLKNIVAATMALAFIAGTAAPAIAAPCRDAKGKFVKCPPVKPAPVRCKNAKGQFAKCGTPGAKPVK
jgi:hypothetical protein